MCIKIALALLLVAVQRADAVAVCTAVATGLPFGMYSPVSGTNDDIQSTVTVTCVTISLINSFSYTVFLSKGTGASYSPRQMASGANRLAYNIYKDSMRTITWGDGTGGTSVNNFSGNLAIGATINVYNLYGRITAGTNGQSGIYADSITVTVNY